MAITQTTIDIGWTNGTHPYLPVYYSVYFGDGTFIADAGQNLRYTVTGLSPGTEYSFYVKSRVNVPASVGNELMINSEFNTDQNFTAGLGWNYGPPVADGFANNDGQIGNLVQTAVPFVAGKEYQLNFKTRAASYLGLGLKYAVGTTVFGGAASADGIHKFNLVAGADNTDVSLRCESVNDFLGSVDYFSLKELITAAETVYSVPSKTIYVSTLSAP